MIWQGRNEEQLVWMHSTSIPLFVHRVEHCTYVVCKKCRCICSTLHEVQAPLYTTLLVLYILAFIIFCCSFLILSLKLSAQDDVLSLQCVFPMNVEEPSHKEPPILCLEDVFVLILETFVDFKGASEDPLHDIPVTNKKKP